MSLPLAVLLVLFALPGRPAAPSAALVGREAPDFTLKSTGGQNLRLSEYRGQVVLLNFWARWAGDSRRELPALDRINQTYARAGLVVLGVSIERDQRRAGEYAASLHVSYPVLIAADDSLGRDYAIDKMPMTILIDRAGIVRYVHVGFDSADENIYLDQIRALLRD
jgi:peroxiredoxin